MLALREKFEPRPIGMDYFEKAMKVVTPSLSRADIERYERMARELKRSTI
jgi:transitional endoplasmic reticulum ATPase